MKINRKDVEFLFELYKMRCLSLELVHKYFYRDKDFIKEKIGPMRQAELIRIRKQFDQYYLDITQKGLDFMKKYLDIPNETYNIERNRYEKSLLNLSDVLIEDKYIRHQVALNEFVLEYKSHYGKINYYDEKFISGLSTILRPDGMIRIGNIDLYLEQDMGTENAKQLRDKWYRYRRYLSQGYRGKQKIVVLFIIKCQNPEKRDLLVRKTIMESFDQLLSNNFEIYIGTKDQLLNACYNRIIPGDKERTLELHDLMQKHKYTIRDGSILKVKLGGVVYRYYLANLDQKKRIGYYGPDSHRAGRFQEFLADNYDYSPMTVLSKVRFHQKNSKNFDIAYSGKADARLIGYIILTRDIKTLYQHMKACELLDVENVYITTPSRLKNYSLPKALIRIDKNGQAFSCANCYFDPKIKEGSIDNFSINGLPNL